ARVSAVAPGAGIGTGQVTFTEGDAVLGRAPVGSDGVTVLQVPLGPGEHPVRATYSGDGNFHGTEAVLTVDVPRGDGGSGGSGGSGGGSAGGGGQQAPQQRGRLLGAAVRPDGTLVAHVRCATGRVTVTANRRGKRYASGSASCTGARVRLTLAPVADARRTGKVHVVATFGDGRTARLSVSAPKRQPGAAG
ncbi:MAG TPA: Ig-like domain-containing protein, partial [Capillimicrobium sp.]